jgi:hypothetical protein
MHSSRKSSVKRHIANLHSGQGVFVSYTDYLAGRRDGYYFPNAPPNFIDKPKPELVLSPPKMYDVFQEEVWREMARQAIRKRR